MVKIEMKSTPWGGVHQVTFLMVFGVGAPSGAQEASRGSPGVPRVIPSTTFMIYCRFGVDFDVILIPFGAQAIT